MSILEKGVIIADNSVYNIWEEQVVSDDPNCQFVSSIKNQHYKRQLLWFLWMICKAEKKSTRRLYFFWLCLWQELFEQSSMVGINGKSDLKTDFEVASGGIIDIMDGLGIDDPEECLLGRLGPREAEGKEETLPL